MKIDHSKTGISIDSGMVLREIGVIGCRHPAVWMPFVNATMRNFNNVNG